MTALLFLLLLAAIYYNWHPATTTTIAVCTILTLILDTRAAVLTRKTHQ